MFQLSLIVLVVLISSTSAYINTHTKCISSSRINNSIRLDNKKNPLSLSSSFRLYAKEPKITRESEDEYFESDWEKKSVQERLPYAYAFVAAVSLPFIVGLIYLYSNK